MGIKTGRYGRVLWDPSGGAAAVEVVSINAWTLDEETEMEDVSCFGDLNKVYVPGMKDLKGTIGGFWNSTELALWKAADAGTPGRLVLMPNSTEAAFKFEGPAYMNASIDCSLAAPTVQGTWAAGGSWATPGQILATGAIAGTPGSFTPAGATPPGTPAGMSAVVATPLTAWTVGQSVRTLDGQDVHWSGSAWVIGIA